MKKLLLTLALLAATSILSTSSWAQCNGVFANNTVCGNVTGANNTPRPTNPSAFLGAAGGTNGQIQYNNSGALGGFTANGDCTVNTITGDVICTKTNSVAFGPFATSSALIQSTSTITGATTTFTSAQNNSIINRSNSGSPMGDILPGTSPGILPAGTLITIANLDTAGVMSIKAGAGAAIKTIVASTGFIYLCPGQTTSFFSDGANYWEIQQPGRCVLKAATSIFVSAAGSNTNDGLTSATALLDPTFTWNMLFNSFDIQGQALTINGSASGTFPQITFDGLLPGTVVTRNGNNVTFLGNPTTPANVKIADTSGAGFFGAVQVFGNAVVTLNGFQITSTNHSDLIADLNANVIYQNIDWHGVGSGLNHIISEYGGRITLAGPEIISSGAGCHWIAGNGGQIETSGAITPVTTITGTTAWTSGYACTQYSGSNIVIQGSYTITGGATGPKVDLQGGGYVNSGALGGCGNFPGSTAGTVSTNATCQ